MRAGHERVVWQLAKLQKSFTHFGTLNVVTCEGRLPHVVLPRRDIIHVRPRFIFPKPLPLTCVICSLRTNNTVQSEYRNLLEYAVNKKL